MAESTTRRNQAGTSVGSADPSDDWGVDSIHRRLVDAAASEFAESGLDGARVQAIAARAGLSTGAIYNRFAGRLELLLEALEASFTSVWDEELLDGRFDEAFQSILGPLPLAAPSRGDALMVETMSAAHRHPELRSAATQWWNRETKLLDEAANSGIENGTIDPALDADALVFFSMALTVGVRVLRQAGVQAPKPDAWNTLIANVTASFSSPESTASFSSPESTASFSSPESTASFSSPESTASFSSPESTASFSSPESTASFSSPDGTSGFSNPTD